MSNMNRAAILDYMQNCGAEAAANLLLLAGPDAYNGDYADYKDLERLLNKLVLLEPNSGLL